MQRQTPLKTNYSSERIIRSCGRAFRPQARAVRSQKGYLSVARGETALETADNLCAQAKPCDDLARTSPVRVHRRPCDCFECTCPSNHIVSITTCVLLFSCIIHACNLARRANYTRCVRGEVPRACNEQFLYRLLSLP